MPHVPRLAGAAVNALAFIAYDTPRPQGSKRHVGGGRMIEQVKGLPTWREAVKQAALDAKPDGWTPLGGDSKNPVALFAKVVFTLARPGSARRCDVAPCRTPDVSKLLRSTEDAMTAAGVWSDDARVTDYLRLAKVWWGHDDEALPLPGVVAAVGTTHEATRLAFFDAFWRERKRLSVPREAAG